MKRIFRSKKFIEVITAIISFLVMTNILYAISQCINRSRYDVNNDGIVNSEDLLELRKYLLEIEG